MSAWPSRMDCGSKWAAACACSAAWRCFARKWRRSIGGWAMSCGWRRRIRRWPPRCWRELARRRCKPCRSLARIWNRTRLSDLPTWASRAWGRCWRCQRRSSDSASIPNSLAIWIGLQDECPTRRTSSCRPKPSPRSCIWSVPCRTAVRFCSRCGDWPGNWLPGSHPAAWAPARSSGPSPRCMARKRPLPCASPVHAATPGRCSTTLGCASRDSVRLRR